MSTDLTDLQKTLEFEILTPEKREFVVDVQKIDPSRTRDNIAYGLSSIILSPLLVLVKGGKNTVYSIAGLFAPDVLTEKLNEKGYLTFAQLPEYRVPAMFEDMVLVGGNLPVDVAYKPRDHYYIVPPVKLNKNNEKYHNQWVFTKGTIDMMIDPDMCFDDPSYAVHDPVFFLADKRDGSLVGCSYQDYPLGKEVPFTKFTSQFPLHKTIAYLHTTKQEVILGGLHHVYYDEEKLPYETILLVDTIFTNRGVFFKQIVTVDDS